MKPDKRQRYHLEPPKGLLNDPNGLVWFRGKYYVFFQWNRFRKDHSHKEWGYFTSGNLVDWEFHGGAVRPGEPYDQSGTHSGSALVIDGQLCVFYTGSDKSSGVRKSSQCMAVSADGIRFEKRGVVVETPAGFTEHFRDPKVFRTGENNYFMVVGAQQENGRGAVVLCRSKDGMHWSYANMLAGTDEYEMVECPDLFRLGGQDILLCCLQKRDNEADEVISAHAVYRLTSFDTQTGTIPDMELGEGCEVLDSGFDFFAPQTFEAPDGRRMLFAWMSRMDDEQERVFAEDEPRIHCLTLPRELSLKNGRLFQRPARELYGMLGEHVQMVHETDGVCCARMDSRTYHLTLQAESFPAGLYIGLGEVSLLWEGGRFVLIRRNWAGNDEVRACLPGRLKCVEVWSDVSSVEVFLNDGEQVFSARVFPMEETPVITVAGAPEAATLTVRKVKSQGCPENEKVYATELAGA